MLLQTSNPPRFRWKNLDFYWTRISDNDPKYNEIILHASLCRWSRNGYFLAVLLLKQHFEGNALILWTQKQSDSCVNVYFVSVSFLKKSCSDWNYRHAVSTPTTVCTKSRSQQSWPRGFQKLPCLFVLHGCQGKTHWTIDTLRTHPIPQNISHSHFVRFHHWVWWNQMWEHKIGPTVIVHRA